MPTVDRDADQMSRLTLRLPTGEFELLRDAAYRSRLPVASLARSLLLRVLADGELPPPPPPAFEDLTAEAQQLLTICHALTSNLKQLELHAVELGEPLSRLAGEAGELAKQREKARVTGLSIKRGDLNPERCIAALEVIRGASEEINSLAHALNQNRFEPSLAAWHGPLNSVRLALEKI